MHLTTQLLIGLIAVVHLWFLVLEMFLWQTARGRATFGTDAEFAARSAPLAANQGLYNGFLSAGLAWSLLAGAPGDPDGFTPAVFFLSCVLIAGVYGAATVSRRILVVQALPAACALTACLLSR
ncbi:hypothetical protein N566_17250 [Streptomycetaceae bacterium MP113-05]|nr:hypothetical protein N566_17250 [Streptomycetaceae bacterium MP113-05]